MVYYDLFFSTDHRCINEAPNNYGLSIAQGMSDICVDLLP